MNANQEKRMDQVRIAELRLHEKHLRASGQMVGACLGECLDAIEAAQAELATAQARIREMGSEEVPILREIVRLLDEARQRYARVPRAGAATSMGDEIDELLNQLFEMGAHPADMRPKPPTPDVVPVPMEELAVLRDGFGLLRTAWNLSLCGERIGAQAGALIERYDALRAGEAGKGGAT